MSKPNRAGAAYVPKRPFDYVEGYPRNQQAAHEHKSRLEAEGFEAKVTSLKVGPRGINGWLVFRVWKRTPE